MGTVVRSVRASNHRAHRFLPSTRQSGVERFNGELNVEANLPLKLVFLFMEDNVGTLDIEDRYHLGGCEMLGYSLLLHADEQLVAHWDVHSESAPRAWPCSWQAWGQT